MLTDATTGELSNPRISIGIPVFNGERYIRQCLDSILDQSYQDFEVVICDNASTDKTSTICEEYARRDHRISYHRNDRNIGAAANYNKAFELSRGEFFKWAAHDDFLDRHFLEACLDVLDSYSDAVLAFTKTTLVDAHGVDLGGYDNELHLIASSAVSRFKRCLLRSQRMCTPIFGVIRRAALLRTSLIGNYCQSDQVLLGHLALLGTLRETDASMIYRRIHEEASMKANRTQRSLAQWFNGDRQLVLPTTLVHFVKMIECCFKVDMTWREQWQSVFFLAKRLWWSRKTLTSEIRELYSSRAY